MNLVTTAGPGRPIRVLFVNDHLGYAHGVTHGSTTYLASVLPSFDPARVDARLCILRGRHPAAARFDDAGVEVEFLGRGKWDPRVIPDLVSLIRRWDVDVVQLNGRKAHLLGRIAARLADRIAILHLHMLYEPRPRFLQAWLARRTSLAIGVSEPLTALAVDSFRIPAERAVTIHNGIRLDPFIEAAGRGSVVRSELGLTADAPLVVVAGRVTTRPDKGHRQAIEAMRLVVSDMPDARLVIAGDGPARSDCERRVGELRLGDAVQFLGHRCDVPALYDAADVVLVPSIVDEALSYAALEGSAAGRPVVAFDGGGMPEIIEHGETGLLVPKGNVTELAAAVIRLLGDRDLRGRMGRAGALRAAQFDLATHVDRLDRLYHALMNRPAALAAP